ncbi:ankyrin repeat domain-containing protein [Wolbachia endosymbiont of Mansonella perstans]|uniref:ankyrin repeat domain-containing protein n=1 Tax=Wolbachia endosymbiont of Mansonella perstans TaxID=229526 RepID=UPI001CE1C9B2|nr:ankyrin repeat domain-containing protein [Wolbachia endosymbiont of Mansonella perstans]MCA4774184.1 ankyrin repeat domain-containing protein [Wolbachia endosymbiont of Mansonella perstans]
MLDRCGRTPYTTLLCVKALTITEYFLKKGDDVNAKNEDGNTSLHLAVVMENVDVAMVLLTDNSDVNAKNSKRMTALHYATDFYYMDLVKLLLTHGAVPVSAEGV